MDVNLNNHTREDLNMFKNRILSTSNVYHDMTPLHYHSTRLEHGDRKSYSFQSITYRELFFLLLFINIIYFAVFLYLYSKDLVKIY